MKRDESGMAFTFPEGRTLPIEDFVKREFRPAFKCVEFASAYRGNGRELLRFVEAKTTFPNPGNPEATEDFRYEAGALVEKFANSLALVATTLLDRHKASGLIPQGLDRESLARMEWFLILVVRGHTSDHAKTLGEALARPMRPLRDAFGLPSNFLLVLTEEGAHKRGMIQRPTTE